MSTKDIFYKSKIQKLEDLDSLSAINKEIFDYLADLLAKNPGKPLTLSETDRRYIRHLEALKRKFRPDAETILDSVQDMGLTEGDGKPTLREESEFEDEAAFFEYAYNVVGHAYPPPFPADQSKAWRWDKYCLARWDARGALDENNPADQKIIEEMAREGEWEYASPALRQAFKKRDTATLLSEIPEEYRENLSAQPLDVQEARLNAILDYLEAEQIEAALLRPIDTEIAAQKKAEKAREEALALQEERLKGFADAWAAEIYDAKPDTKAALLDVLPETPRRLLAKLAEDEQSSWVRMLFADYQASKEHLSERLQRLFKASCVAEREAREEAMQEAHNSTSCGDGEKWVKAAQVPEDDLTDEEKALRLTPQQKREATISYQKRLLRRGGWKAELYLSVATASVGGPVRQGRAKYISRRAFWKWVEEKRHQQEMLENMRLVRVDDRLIQICALEASKNGKRRHLAEQRLFVDATMARMKANQPSRRQKRKEGIPDADGFQPWEKQGLWQCWITVTLPGRYVPYSTNEENREEAWDVSLGQEEAAKALQDMHHQLFALLRERGIRPFGLWSAQAQINGNPHRHYLLAVRGLDAARELCDAFRAKFGNLKSDEMRDEGAEKTYENSRACAAYVIGDRNKAYAPKVWKKKSGDYTEEIEETTESVGLYLARYATRFTAQDVDFLNDEIKPTKQLLHDAWATLHNMRTLTFMGLKREGGKAAWRILWAAMERGEEGTSLRTRLAISLMQQCRTITDKAATLRLAAMEEEDEEMRRLCLEEPARLSKLAGKKAYRAMLAAGCWDDKDFTARERKWLKQAMRQLRKKLLREALSEEEILEFEQESDRELPPVVVHQLKTSKYGEHRKEGFGLVPYHAVKWNPDNLKQVASYDESKLIKRSLEEWEIMERETAEQQVLEIIEDVLKERELKDRSSREVVNKYIYDDEHRDKLFSKWKNRSIKTTEELIIRSYELSVIPTVPSQPLYGRHGNDNSKNTYRPPPNTSKTVAA